MSKRYHTARRLLTAETRPSMESTKLAMKRTSLEEQQRESLSFSEDDDCPWMKHRKRNWRRKTINPVASPRPCKYEYSDKFRDQAQIPKDLQQKQAHPATGFQSSVPSCQSNPPRSTCQTRKTQRQVQQWSSRDSHRQFCSPGKVIGLCELTMYL